MNTNINEHFIIQKFSNGIKTIRPENLNLPERELIPHAISSMIKSPFCFYFLNFHSENVLLNSESLQVCGFSSMQEAKGHTMADIAEKYTALQVMNSHQLTMKTQKIQVIEDDVLLKNAHSFQCMTIVLPWYNEDNKIAGVLGCSVIPGKHSFSQSLSHIFNIGLYNPENHFAKQLTKQFLMNNIYLSSREYQCVQLLKQGYTAKKIGKLLNLSHRTVEHYLENVKNKIGVSSKNELIQMLS